MNASCTASRAGAGEPGVVRRRGHAPLAQRRRDLLGAPPRGGVDDARAAGVDDGLQQLARLASARRRARSTARRCSAGRSPRTAPAGRACRRRSTISARTGGAAVAVSASTGGAAELLDERAEPQVVRPEVVAPLADAVRLVDHEQRRRRLLQLRERLRPRELLGRQEQVLELAVLSASQRLARPLAEGRVQFSRGRRASCSGAPDLVALQGDERARRRPSARRAAAPAIW